MFVNDNRHPRHIKGFKPPVADPEKKEELKEDPLSVEINHVYNLCPNDDEKIISSKFINEDQQSQLNNDYDYAITKMFRIFLKTDAVYMEYYKEPRYYHDDSKKHVA